MSDREQKSIHQSHVLVFRDSSSESSTEQQSTVAKSTPIQIFYGHVYKRPYLLTTHKEAES